MGSLLRPLFPCTVGSRPVSDLTGENRLFGHNNGPPFTPPYLSALLETKSLVLRTITAFSTLRGVWHRVPGTSGQKPLSRDTAAEPALARESLAPGDGAASRVAHPKGVLGGLARDG